MTDLWETLPFDVHQSSLNGHQTGLDSDGVFRAVISTCDPGIPGWLDPVGNTRGLIRARVLQPRSSPEMSLKKIPLDELRQHPHPDTPAVTPADRSASLQRRMCAAAQRYRE